MSRKNSNTPISWPGLAHHYRKYLPIKTNDPVVTLLEGNTPLIHSEKLSEKIGGKVYLKFEGLNPTGSFKDRGMTIAVSHAMAENSKAVMCASTGNTSASAAAYAARAGLKCFVLLPEGKVALGKLSQALMHNATIIAIKGNFDEALTITREITAAHPITLVNSVNPYRIEGQKTGAFEICDQLGYAPDYHFIPVGNAGNITAYWKGYGEYFRSGLIKSLPKMMGFQASGSAPIVKGKPIANPKTIATAIRIGNPASWKSALDASYESKGRIDAVTDKEILSAYRWLAAHEGVFAEPASAASVAGLLKYFKANPISKSKRGLLTIVCVLTGHGLKDPQTSLQSVKLSKPVGANIKSVLKAMQI